MADAQAILRSVLESYGLGQLADWAYQQVTSAADLDMNVFMTKLREQPAYKERFAGNEIRRAAGLNVLSESEYLAMEDTYKQIARAGGLPTGMLDRGETTKLIGGDVSPAEWAQRVNEGYKAAQQADPIVRGQLKALYGVGDGELAAFFLEPDRALPLIERQFGAAKVAAEAQRTGFGQLTLAEAEQLRAQGLTPDQAAQSFGQLAQSAPLFGAIDTGEDPIDRATQLAAISGNTAAANRIATRQRRRAQALTTTGQYATNKEGMIGVGIAT